MFSVPLTCVQSRTWSESGTVRGNGNVSGTGNAYGTMPHPEVHSHRGLGGSRHLVGSGIWSGNETFLWTPSGPWAWIWSEKGSGTGCGGSAQEGVVCGHVGVVCACRFPGSCFFLYHRTSFHGSLGDSQSVWAGARRMGCVTCVFGSCGCESAYDGCPDHNHDHHAAKSCAKIPPLSLASDWVSFDLPARTGFQSVGHTPTSCPGCEEHLLRRAHLQTEYMQILSVGVNRSQVECRHLLQAHSDQTHAANPQAWIHRKCS